MPTQDFLLEIGTEELPPKQLLILSQALARNLQQELNTHALPYTTVKSYATPRRLAVLIKNLVDTQNEQIIERRGPAFNLAFTAEGKPTTVAHKFAASCGIDAAQLEKYENDKGKWVIAKITKPGNATSTLLPQLVTNAVAKLLLAKTMHWGTNKIEFVRPVHWITMLYGETTITATILGIAASNLTYGHRFHHPQPITLANASDYEKILETQGYVIADFNQRKNIIRAKVIEIATPKGKALIDDALLEEVTGLVEWSEALFGTFDSAFLKLPREVLITSLEQQQRCFPIVDTSEKLCPYFITISNIHSKNPQQVIAGNNRVIKARLTDAEFFYRTDLGIPLDDYLNKLKTVVFQDKLGSLYDKSLRLMELSGLIATQLNFDPIATKRAAQLAKADLMSSMVGEFPELQGIMGYYYALAQHESEAVAAAIKEHYLPRFAGDTLPQTDIGAVLALVDRIDTLIGIFGINKIPTGEKDPLGLRRAALGIIRIILTKNFNLDLSNLLQIAQQNYQNTLDNPAATTQVLDFIYERLRNWYDEQKINLNTFNAVLARRPTNLNDFDRRIKALESFRLLPAAESLSAAHKRINNLLNKAQTEETLKFEPKLLQDPAEKELYLQLMQKSAIIKSCCENAAYPEALLALAELKPAVDKFFTEVMVMVDHRSLRDNRLALLMQLRELFNLVADFSLLYAVM